MLHAIQQDRNTGIAQAMIITLLIVPQNKTKQFVSELHLFSLIRSTTPVHFITKHN
jgi:hypothetical protein